jgi:hypothetical protein
MWNSVSRGDLERAQDDVQRRRLDMEARHAEEFKNLEARQAEERSGLDAKLAQLGEIERAIEAFVDEYLQSTPAGDTDAPAAGLAAPPAGDLVNHLSTPAQVEVIATNWGKASFTPAESVGVRPARDWGE